MLGRINHKIARTIRRLVKHGRQYLIKKKNSGQQVLFILGAQRSGTNMLVSVFDKFPFSRTYNEDDPSAFSKTMRIKSPGHIRALLDCPASLIVFKPIIDSHKAREFLNEYPNSKIIWIYRNYLDVANSATVKWKDAQRHIVRHIAEKNNSWDRYYTEALTDQDRDFVRSLYSKDMSEVSAGVLNWYLRNRLFFKLDLEKEERVLLVNYERLVLNPDREFSRIGQWLGVGFDPSYYHHLFKTSVKKSDPDEIDDEIQEISQDLWLRLEMLLSELESEASR